MARRKKEKAVFTGMAFAMNTSDGGLAMIHVVWLLIHARSFTTPEDLKEAWSVQVARWRSPECVTDAPWTDPAIVKGLEEIAQTMNEAMAKLPL